MAQQPNDSKDLVLPNSLPAKLSDSEKFTAEIGKEEIKLVFDGLMESVKGLLTEEYDKQRLRGADYAKVYLGSIETMMTNTVQYLVGMSLVDANRAKIQADIDQTSWQTLFLLPAQKDQLEAQTDQIRYQTDYLLPAQVNQTEAQTLLTEEQIRQTQYQTDEILPTEKLKLIEETNLLSANIAKTQYEYQQLMPVQKDQIIADTDKTNTEALLIATQRESELYRKDYILPKEVATLDSQISKTTAEISLLNAKISSEAKQPALADAQVALYNRQKTAFDDDFSVKKAKVAVDGWSVYKTVDEFPAPPTWIINPVAP